MKNRMQTGSITVFLSLLLVLLISVVTASLESAHLAAVRSQIGMGSEAAMNNLLSRFEKSLYEKYKLLFLNDRQDFSEILENEIKVYEQLEGTVLKEGNHLRFASDAVKVKHLVYLLDNDGKAFQEEINQILASDVIAMVKQMITGSVEKLSQSGTVTEYMNQIMEQSPLLSEMSENVSAASEQASSGNKGIGELKDAAESCMNLVKDYQRESSQPGSDQSSSNQTDSSQSGSNQAERKKTLEMEVQKLSEKKQNLEKNLENVLAELKEYKAYSKTVNENLSDVREGLKNEELDDSYKEALHGELKSVLDMTSESGEWYDRMEKAEKTVTENLQTVRSIKIPSGEDLSKESILSGRTEEMLQKTTQAMERCAAVDIPVKETAVENKYSFSAKSLLKTVQTLITEGVFSIVVDNKSKLSKREVDNRDMPSAGNGRKAAESGKNMFQTMVDKSRDTLTLNIYLSQYMDSYTDDKNYDLEYIIGGSNSDIENLKAAVNQLVFLRQAMNLVYLFTDTVKRQQAQSAAAAILAVTANAVLIEGLAVIILTAWAYAEAVSDVRALIHGEKVTFMKNSGTWKLSLESAADYKNWTKESGAKDESGMNYEEYLRILLFFHSRELNMLRGLDMIQWNICQDDPGFRISQCVYSVGTDFALKVKPVFVSMSAIGWGGDGGYTFNHKETKSYA
ncbi:MAG: DUF5702 domain-containing protein [Lachnospiraceae bacterium]|nr:DUF5702 domain-containing protein [Lachnospiraceae bacterium]